MPSAPETRSFQFGKIFRNFAGQIPKSISEPWNTLTIFPRWKNFRELLPTISVEEHVPVLSGGGREVISQKTQISIK